MHTSKQHSKSSKCFWIKKFYYICIPASSPARLKILQYGDIYSIILLGSLLISRLFFFAYWNTKDFMEKRWLIRVLRHKWKSRNKVKRKEMWTFYVFFLACWDELSCISLPLLLEECLNNRFFLSIFSRALPWEKWKHGHYLCLCFFFQEGRMNFPCLRS